VHYRVLDPAQYGIIEVTKAVHEGRTQTGWRTANAGSRLKPLITQEGTAWKASLPAVLGKTRRIALGKARERRI
jgi:hypothetical protein